ncbi:MAG: addiction module antidote protein [Caldilineaceae bacterium]
MTLKTKPFDADKYFLTEESQTHLLNDALASGDAGYIAHALGTIAQAQGMAQLEEDAGASLAAIFAVLTENSDPSLETILRATWSLGLELPFGTVNCGPDGDPEFCDERRQKQEI